MKTQTHPTHVLTTQFFSTHFIATQFIGRIAVILVVLFAHILFTGCTAEELSGNTEEIMDAGQTTIQNATQNKSQSVFSAQINGRNWSPNMEAAFSASVGLLTISATQFPTEALVIVATSSEVGEYALVDKLNSTKAFALAFATTNASYEARKGILRITSIDKDWVEGTFEAELVEDVDDDENVVAKTITITNGKFKIKSAEK